MGKGFICKELCILVSYIFTSTNILFLEKTVQWGIVHLTLARNFRNYTNITFVDEKLNLCDFIVDLLKLHCPIPPGIYQLNYTDTVPNQFWPVSNRYSVSLLLFYFIGSVLWQNYCVQSGRRGNDVSNDRGYYKLMT